MDRIYLYVSPEEYPEVKASGASWDDASKSWYIGDGMEPAIFSRWLGEEQDDAPFGIVSEEAFVARAQAPCLKCHENIEVVCVHCKSGVDSEVGELMTRFTVSNVWAIDSALAEQLGPWPLFRKGIGADSAQEYFANHCPHCGAIQEDYLLHAEPGDVFFGLTHERPGSIEFTALEGRIQLSGDYGFEV